MKDNNENTTKLPLESKEPISQHLKAETENISPTYQSHHTKEVLELASQAGFVMLQNGGEIFRVGDTMKYITSHFGVNNERFILLSNGIFSASDGHATLYTVPMKGAQLDKVVAINQLSRDITSNKYTIEQAKEQLENIKAMPSKPKWLQILASAMGCASFCTLFGGGFSDCLVSFIVGFILWIFVSFVSGPHLSKLLGNICCGFLVTMLCIILYKAGLGSSLANIIIGSMIPLIPGIAFTNGLRDIANEDYLAGATRLLDASLVFLCVATGLTFAFLLNGYFDNGIIQLSATRIDKITSLIPIQLIAVFIGNIAFAVLFGVPSKHYLNSGIVGTMGWLVYLLIARYTHLASLGGCFAAAAIISIASVYMARKIKCPGIIFLICGLLPLVPGAGIFWSAYYIVVNDLSMALSTGFVAIKAMVCIVLGILIANAIFSNKPKIGKTNKITSTQG